MSDNPINCTVTECPARTTDGRCYLLPQDCPQTLEAGILKANEHIRKRIQVKREKIDALDCQMQLLRMRLTPPCKFCQYEGEIRCTSCKDGDYEGFNVRHYPMHGDKTCFTCRKGPRCLEETARACTTSRNREKTGHQYSDACFLTKLHLIAPVPMQCNGTQKSPSITSISAFIFILWLPFLRLNINSALTIYKEAACHKSFTLAR